jgi:hypothetical protein
MHLEDNIGSGFEKLGSAVDTIVFEGVSRDIAAFDWRKSASYDRQQGSLPARSGALC